MERRQLDPGNDGVLYYSFAQGGGTIPHRSDGDVFSINLELLLETTDKGGDLSDSDLDSLKVEFAKRSLRD